MSTTTKYRFELDRTSKKVRCEGCGQKTAVPYRDNETSGYLPFHVARCDRENRCGYHYTPKQYFADNGHDQNGQPKPFIEVDSIEPARVDFLPMEFLTRSLDQRFYSRNNFFQFIESLYGEAVAKQLFLKYLIGTSNHWKGSAVFPQIDEAGNLRQVKIMLHDSESGKRIKQGSPVLKWDRDSKVYCSVIAERSCSLVYGKYINHETQYLNLEQTFFGCHLLSEHPDKPVCIVESEKTAVIASVYLPHFIWLATGGASGCKWRDYANYKVLQGRSVTFFPDYGFFNARSKRTCFQEWTERCARIAEVLPNTKIRVSDILEKRLLNTDRNDQDLADLLLKRDEATGLALTEAGYPVIFDFK